MLTAKEPREFCLGYTAVGSSGAAIGSEFAQRIAAAMRFAIDRGIEQVDHFEELAIFSENVGAGGRVTCASGGRSTRAIPRNCMFRWTRPPYSQARAVRAALKVAVEQRGLLLSAPRRE